MGKNNYKEKEIDGDFYIFTLLKPRISLALLSRLVKIIGPPLGKAFPANIKIKEILDANIDIGGAVIELANRFNDKEVQDIIDILFTQVAHKGEGILSQELTYEKLFAGRIKHLFKVVSASLEVQYADFLEGKDALATILQKSREVTAAENLKDMT